MTRITRPASGPPGRSGPDEGIVQALPKGRESLSRRLHQSAGLGVTSKARFLFHRHGRGKWVYADRHKPSLTCAITNGRALDLLRQVVPYLSTYKAQRASLLLSDDLQLTPRKEKYLAAPRTRAAVLRTTALVDDPFGLQAGPG